MCIRNFIWPNWIYFELAVGFWLTQNHVVLHGSGQLRTRIDHLVDGFLLCRRTDLHRSKHQQHTALLTLKSTHFGYRSSSSSPLTRMSSSVMKPVCATHHGSTEISTGLAGSRSLADFLRKNFYGGGAVQEEWVSDRRSIFLKWFPSLILISALTLEDLHWFIRSMYWFLPMPSNRRPGGREHSTVMDVFLIENPVYYLLLPLGFSLFFLIPLSRHNTIINNRPR